jgi:hypothetical protein
MDYDDGLRCFPFVLLMLHVFVSEDYALTTALRRS